MRDSSRRGFLGGALGAGGLLLTGCGSDPAPTPPAPEPAPLEPDVAAPSAVEASLPDGLDPRFFHVHRDRPLSLETRREELGSGLITPTRRLFVRNNLPRPDDAVLEDRDAWTVSVEGVGTPREVSVGELRTMGVTTVVAVLQCSGNGRRFFEHGPSGSPWGVGAAGCVQWTGVPVSTVIEALGGVAGEPRFLTATGGEENEGAADQRVERSIPAEEATRGDALLAWELNGEPIPITHGGPLRFVVPGYYGCNQIKYVRRLAFSDTSSDARMMRSSYRVRPIGESGNEEQPTMWRMNVKSFVDRPSGSRPIAAGAHVVTGVAFSGGTDVSAVELSVDGGATWSSAELIGPPLGGYAWRRFAMRVDLPVGEHVLMSRASTREETQPMERVENERGYGNNSIRDMAVTLVSCAPEDVECLTPPDVDEREGGGRGPIELSAAGRRGREIFLSTASPTCASCHTLREAGATSEIGPDLDSLHPTQAQITTAVTQGVGVMPSMQDTLTEAQIRDVATYVREVTQSR